MKRSAIVFIALFILQCLSSLASFAQEKKVVTAPDIIPPATEAMQKPEFWVSRLDTPDKIIMTADQIEAFNRKNLDRSLEMTDINGKSFSLARLDNRPYAGLQFFRRDPLEIKSVPGDSLRTGLEKSISYLNNRTFWDRRRVPLPDATKEEIADDMALDSIPSVVQPKYGIVVKHTLCRRVPTNLRAFGRQFDWLDMFQVGAYEMGTNVAVLHVSENGDWYYVKSELSYRWIPAANVALGSVDEIRKVSNPDDFLVAIGHKVPVYSDSSHSLWMTDYYQGAKLGLIGKSSSGYSVSVPYRRPDGSLDTVAGHVKPGADVTVGYQPFNQRNVITTFFKLLNHPYGWGDSGHERDCCGALRTVFNTFGIVTPRAPTHQFYYSDHVKTFPKDMAKEDKYRLFDETEPGISICGFNGHILMYLGNVGEDYFVIHSNGYSYHDKDGTEMRVARTSVTSLELEGGADINNFTEISTYKP